MLFFTSGCSTCVVHEVLPFYPLKWVVVAVISEKLSHTLLLPVAIPLKIVEIYPALFAQPLIC